MLTNMRVLSQRASLPELVVGSLGASSDVIQIRDIEGLGPVKAAINTTQLGSFDGELYNGSSVGKRNIVLTLGLNPFWTHQSMASLRGMLYAYFMVKQLVRLQFVSDHLPTVQIDGYVESFEPNMFSKDPEIQISVICPKPNFVASESTEITGIVATTIDTPTEIDYVGTVEAGFSLEVVSSVANPSYTGDLIVRNNAPFDQVFTVEDVTIDITQYYRLNTKRGKKRVQSVDASAPSSLLNSISDDSVWPALQPGTNLFSVISGEAGQDWIMTYFAEFGGL